MRPVHDVTVILEVELCLCPELAAKVLGRVGGGTADRLRHLHHVHDDGLDAVPLALDFGLDAGHLVAIEGIAHVAVNVDATHCCGDSDAGLGRRCGVGVDGYVETVTRWTDETIRTLQQQ